MIKVSPENALRYTKFTVFLMFTWPPSRDSSKSMRTLFDVLSWIFLLFPTFLVIFLINAALYQLDDYLSFTKTLCIAVSCSQAVIKMLVCKGQRARLENLHHNIWNFVKGASPRERKLLERYISHCAPVHFGVNMCSLLASLAMILGPFFLPQSLPTEARYPFSVEEHPSKDLAWLHQAVAGFQCASIGSVDCHVALLIWFAGARLELLSEEFENAKNTHEFKGCIMKHQILLANTEEMIKAVRFIILTTSVMTILSIVTGGIHIVSQEPLTVKAQFLIIDCGFASILFVSAWPAENLINMCTKVGHGAYNCRWTRASSVHRRNVLFVIQRSQIPCTISVAGIIPQLSLAYYTSFLSKTFSFFTTLRVVIDKVQEKN